MFKAVRSRVLTMLGFSLLFAAVRRRSHEKSLGVHHTESQPSQSRIGRHQHYLDRHRARRPTGTRIDYQFSAALQGQTQIVRDFSLPNSFVWVPWKVEGDYVVTVVVRDITHSRLWFILPSRCNTSSTPSSPRPGQSAVNITNHPLVALFSVGPCTAGHSIRVRFHQNGSQTTSTTNAVPCSSSSANFLVAGMLASRNMKCIGKSSPPTS